MQPILVEKTHKIAYKVALESPKTSESFDKHHYGSKLQKKKLKTFNFRNTFLNHFGDQSGSTEARFK